MFSDDGLYCFGACHGSLLAHEGSDGTQTVASDASQLPEKGGADVVLDLKFVHDGQMLLLLIPHILCGTGNEEEGGWGSRAEDRRERTWMRGPVTGWRPRT